MSANTRSRESEDSLLGCIMLDNSRLDEVRDLVHVEDLSEPNAPIYQAILDLARDKTAIDPITLSTRLEEMVIGKGAKAVSALNVAGGLDRLLSLGETVATAVNVRHYAQKIRDRADRLNLAQRLTGAGHLALDVTRPIQDAESMARQALEAPTRQVAGFKLWADCVREEIDEIGQRYETRDQGLLPGLPTGISDLDRITSGLQNGDLIALAGRPSMGKTALAWTIGINAAEASGKTVAFFSLEQPTKQLVLRGLSQMARVTSTSMRNGDLSRYDLDQLFKAQERLQDLPLAVDDQAGINCQYIRSKLKALEYDPRYPDLGLVIVDYLQIMKADELVKSREGEISSISGGLKAIAKAFGVPVIELSQLSRKLEDRPDKRPKMSDLRESGAIEQDADLILFVYRDEVYNEDTPDKGIAELILAKHRNGSLGTVRTKFFRQWTQFADLIDEPAPLFAEGTQA